MERQPVSPETLAARGLGEEDPVSGGLVPVINLSTNFDILPRRKAGESSCYADWSSR
jgi:hypothetical protein